MFEGAYFNKILSQISLLISTTNNEIITTEIEIGSEIALRKSVLWQRLSVSLEIYIKDNYFFTMNKKIYLEKFQ